MNEGSGSFSVLSRKLISVENNNDTLVWWVMTGPLKKYGTVQPAADLPAPYADVSAQNQQQFTR